MSSRAESILRRIRAIENRGLAHHPLLGEARKAVRLAVSCLSVGVYEALCDTAEAYIGDLEDEESKTDE